MGIKKKLSGELSYIFTEPSEAHPSDIYQQVRALPRTRLPLDPSRDDERRYHLVDQHLERSTYEYERDVHRLQQQSGFHILRRIDLHERFDNNNKTGHQGFRQLVESRCKPGVDEKHAAKPGNDHTRGRFFLDIR